MLHRTSLHSWEEDDMTLGHWGLAYVRGPRSWHVDRLRSKTIRYWIWGPFSLQRFTDNGS